LYYYFRSILLLLQINCIITSDQLYYYFRSIALLLQINCIITSDQYCIITSDQLWLMVTMGNSQNWKANKSTNNDRPQAGCRE